MPASSIPARGPDRMIQRHSEASPSRTAFLYRGKTFTYADVARQTEALSASFQQYFTPGEPVALWLPNSPEIILACLAGFKAGVVPMPVNFDSKLAELAGIIRHARCRHLLITPAMAESIKAADFGNTELKTIRVINGSELTLLHTLEPKETDPGRKAPCEPDRTTALILHTSGSSGQPKGVMISHTALEHIIQGRIHCANISENSTAVIASSLAHSVGLYQALAFLYSGAAFVLLESYAMDRLAETVNSYKPSHLIMVVSAFEQLLVHARINAGSFQNIVFAAVGADRVTQQVQDNFMALTGRMLAASYGMTELSWMLLNNETSPDKGTALGRPAPGVDIRLQDENGHDVAKGCVGEIVARSPRAMQAYLYNPELTEETLKDGWIRSADLAYEDADGVFWYVGRTKDLIVLNSGDTVSPMEIEKAVLSLPNIADCIVLGMQVYNTDTGSYSEVPWAFISRHDSTIDAAAIMSHLHQQLSDYKLPRELVFLKEFPRGVSGKISRKELREWWNKKPRKSHCCPT